MTAREQYDRLIEPLRAVARSCGYALAVHGTLERDVDLIAVPWTNHASSASVLAEAIRNEAERICLYCRIGDCEAGALQPEFFNGGCPGMKPHGRMVWSLMLGGGSYLDLSVMPVSPGGSEAF